jgi:hypothetical protein
VDGIPTPQNTTQGLFTTPAGQYGYLPDGTFVATLPNAFAVPLFGEAGEGIVFSPVLLPSDGPPPVVTVNVQSSRYFYTAAGGGNALQVQASSVTPGDHDRVALAYAGGTLAGFDLTPQHGTTALLPKIGMALGPQQRLLFRFWQLDLPGGGTAAFRTLPAAHGVTYANRSAAGSEHFIIVDAVDGAAEVAETRLFGPVAIPPGATQRVTVADWPAGRTLKVETDADGDGVFEKEELFGGRACASFDADDDGVPDACARNLAIYMPIIMRH